MNVSVQCLLSHTCSCCWIPLNIYVLTLQSFLFSCCLKKWKPLKDDSTAPSFTEKKKKENPIIQFYSEDNENTTLKSRLAFPQLHQHLLCVIQGGAACVKIGETSAQQFLFGRIDFLKPGNSGQVHPSGYQQSFHFKNSQCYSALQ